MINAFSTRWLVLAAMILPTMISTTRAASPPGNLERLEEPRELVVARADLLGVRPQITTDTVAHPVASEQIQRVPEYALRGSTT